MQIEIDTEKLPEGITEAQIYDAVESSLMVYIGDFTGAPGHEERVKTCAHVWKALIKPTPPAEVPQERVVLRQCSANALIFLRALGDSSSGINDRQKEWLKCHWSLRERLRTLKAITVDNHPAAGMGDVASRVAKITPLGHAVLKEAAR